MDHDEMRRSVEALLFAADRPLSLKELKTLLGTREIKAIREAISALKEDYEGRSFQLMFLAGGYQLYTRPEYVDLVNKLHQGRKPPKLSPQALETLALIAYRQPVTRIEIERVRGVSVEGVLSTLLERRLIQVVGREKAVGRPILYGTTKEFLTHFQLRDLRDLPEPPESSEGSGKSLEPKAES